MYHIIWVDPSRFRISWRICCTVPGGACLSWSRAEQRRPALRDSLLRCSSDSSDSTDLDRSRQVRAALELGKSTMWWGAPWHSTHSTDSTHSGEVSPVPVTRCYRMLPVRTFTTLTSTTSLVSSYHLWCGRVISAAFSVPIEIRHGLMGAESIKKWFQASRYCRNNMKWLSSKLSRYHSDIVCVFS